MEETTTAELKETPAVETPARRESEAQRKNRLRQVTRVPLTTERVPRGRPCATDMWRRLAEGQFTPGQE